MVFVTRDLAACIVPRHESSHPKELMKPNISLNIFLTVLCGVLFMACDGSNFPAIDVNISTGTDTDGGGTGVGDGDTDDTPGSGLPDIPTVPGGGGGTNVEPRPFQATWFTAFRDDRVDVTLATGFTDYAIRMTLTENNGEITGTGLMARTFPTVPTALQEIAFTVSGFKRGDNDAELTFNANRASDFELTPVWHLRVAGSHLVGLFSEAAASGGLGRSGHAVWAKTSTSGVISQRWGSAWEDSFGTAGFPRRDRVGVVTLNVADALLSGTGQYTELRPSDVVDLLTFEVIRGEVDGSKADPTFGNLDLSGNEYDWVGFYNSSEFAASYAQRGMDGGVVRWGNTTFRPGVSVTPNSIAGRWNTSFADSNQTEARPPVDWLATLDLQATGGNNIGGTGAGIFDQSQTSPQFRSYTISLGQLIGNRLTFTLTRGNLQFDWDCHAAGNYIQGIYQLTTVDTGAFVARGHSEWRKVSTSTNLVGGWVASYFDTVNESSDRQTQLIRVTITNQDTDGNMTGQGVLRFAGERSERTFDMTGNLNAQTITWTLQGAGIAGQTVWTLRRVEGGLFGVYENRNTAGTLESRGHAFFRSTENS